MHTINSAFQLILRQIKEANLSSLGIAALQVQARLDEAAKAQTDGINFDLEDPAGPGSPLARAYTALVAETAAAFHARDPCSQVWPKPTAEHGKNCWPAIDSGRHVATERTSRSSCLLSPSQ